jgi:hypothetical protein
MSKLGQSEWIMPFSAGSLEDLQKMLYSLMRFGIKEKRVQYLLRIL